MWLIDEKRMDVAQPIWLLGFPSKGHFRAKSTTFYEFLKVCPKTIHYSQSCQNYKINIFDESRNRVRTYLQFTLYLMSVTKLNVLLVMSLIEETSFNMQSLFC